MAAVASYLRIISIFGGLALAMTLMLWVSGSGARYRLMVVRGETFTVQVANTPELRDRGLRGRSSLDPDGGLVVVVEPPRVLVYSTSRTDFPLDILYVTADGIVVKIDHLAANDERLDGSVSGQAVSGALLLRGGTADRLQLMVGNWLPVIPPPQKQRYAGD